MPLLTIASAICRISVSLMLQPKVFQVFQPIGGVRATPLSSACASDVDSPTAMYEVRIPAAAMASHRPSRARRCMVSPFLASPPPG